jgi:DNA-binding transcriptional ArsR family regulator
MASDPSQTKNTCCGVKTDIRQRPLLSDPFAGGLEALFKVLANATRLRILHAVMRAGELCVTDLAAAVGMKPQAVSNQLQRLVDRGMVATRRNGTNIFYRIIDPCVVSLLDRGCCLLEDARYRKKGHRWEQEPAEDAASTQLDESNFSV